MLIGAPENMATTRPAYNNSDPRPSGKWPRDLTPWFESCDLPDHLRTTILVMLKRDRHGLQLWMCVTRLAVELGVCRRTVQRRIRRLEEFKVIRKIYDANTRPFPERPDYFRPSATYEAHPEAVKTRPTWKDFEGMRASHRRFRVKSATQHWRCRRSPHLVHASAQQPSEQSSLPQNSLAPPVPVAAVPARDQHHGSGPPHGSRAERTIRELRQDLVARMTALMRGSSERAAMSQENALTSCCMFFGLSEREAAEHLKLVCFRAPRPLPAPEPSRLPSPLPRHEGSPWEKILRVLETKINRHSFETWLKPTRFAGEQEGVLYVKIPAAEFRHVGEKYADLIQAALDELGMDYREVKFEI